MSTTQREFSVVFDEIEGGWIMAKIPELPGAVTQGKDFDEAKANIKEVAELLLESYREQAITASSPKAVWGTVMIDVPEQNRGLGVSFSDEQQSRMRDLMVQWRDARDAGKSIDEPMQVELDMLVNAELVEATKRSQRM